MKSVFKKLILKQNLLCLQFFKTITLNQFSKTNLALQENDLILKIDLHL